MPAVSLYEIFHVHQQNYGLEIFGHARQCGEISSSVICSARRRISGGLFNQFFTSLRT